MSLIQRLTRDFEALVYENPLAFKLYSLPYKPVVIREVKLGGIKSSDIVLNVGCGSIPFTAIHLTEITGAKIYAMDRDEKAVTAARKLVRSMGLESKISILFGDATGEIPEDTDKAVIALQVEPKKEVLTNIMKNGLKKIIMRAPRNTFSGNYDYEQSFIKPVEVIRHNMLTLDKSILYTVE